jgi:hypothetical protein
MSNRETAPAEVACTASQLEARHPHLHYRPPRCGHAHGPVDQVDKEHR